MSGRRHGCIFVLITPTGAVLVAQIVLIVLEDSSTTFAALCFVVGRNPATGDIFNGLLIKKGQIHHQPQNR